MKSLVGALATLLSVAAVVALPTINQYATIPLHPEFRFTQLSDLKFDASICQASADAYVDVYPDNVKQPVVGFGAALTETTAYNFEMLRKRNETAYHDLLHSLFASSASGGIGISFLRVPITSCDLSLPTDGWSFDDVDGDVDLKHFNATHFEAYQSPVLKDIVKLSAREGIHVRLLGSPWSAPAWMKDSKAWGHGRLIDDLYPVYANYLVKVAEYFHNQGIDLWGITLQNEPRFEPGSYPGTLYTPRNESTLAKLVKPLMQKAGLPTIIAAYDHNWDLESFPDEVIKEAGDAVDYIAFHCYAGGVSNQSVFHEQHPNVPIIFTECSQTGNEGSPKDFLNDFMDNQSGLYHGNFHNWGQSTLHWSLGVDMTGGPHSGGCADCSGVVVVDAANSSRPYVVKRNSEFYSLAHFASLIPPNSNVITTTTKGSIDTLAFTTGDLRRVIQILNQDTQHYQVLLRDHSSSDYCVMFNVSGQSQWSLNYQTSSTRSIRLARE